MNRLLAVLYGLVCYLMFVLVILYLLGFIAGMVVPKSLDTPATLPLIQAIAIDFVLLLLFGAQHSIMARPAFKRWWLQFVPAPIERSTYVLFSNAALIVLFWQWQGLPGMIWQMENNAARTLLWILFGLGWVVMGLSTFLINHFDLFGLRQIYLHWRGLPYTDSAFKTPLLYRLVRHPLMLGFLIVFWATPGMSVSHLLFSAGMSAYILLALRYEERDLRESCGPAYAEYQQRVPMLIPGLKPRRK
jgi:protein-S-isoprenylcysteine O-methyltransferase Ste14